MLTRSELTKAQAKDLLEKIQSNMFAGINCGWRRKMVGSVLGLNEVDCFWGHLRRFPLSFWVIIWKCPMIVAKELNPFVAQPPSHLRPIDIVLFVWRWMVTRIKTDPYYSNWMTTSKWIHTSRAVVKGFFGYDNLWPAPSFWVVLTHKYILSFLQWMKVSSLLSVD